MTLLDELKRDEGCVLEVYPDSLGIRTAGVGHNLEACGIDWPLGTPITQEQADTWLLEDAAKASRQVDENLPWAKQLDDVRHDVLVNMCFNMGWGDGHTHGLSTFHRSLAMVQAGNYEGAADAFLESHWANQVGKNPPDEHHPKGGRAWRLAQQMRTGAYA